MKTIDTEAAVGAVLCHDLTRIVKDDVKETAFRKGHVVRPEDVQVLLSMGKDRLYVWDLGEDMAHENEAAEALARICGGEAFAVSPIKEGKAVLTAARDGLFLVDLAKLEAVNGFDELSLAARHSGFPVSRGQTAAGLKVVPLAVKKSLLAQVEELVAGGPLFDVAPYRPLKAGVVATGNEIFHGRIQDQFTPVVEDKLAEYGIRTVSKAVCDDNLGRIVAAIKDCLAQGLDLIVCTGGMSVDPDDLTPGAIKAAGAELVVYGAPVQPGAMFLAAYFGDVPILGLPGCVMFGRRTIFDVVLPRIAAGRRLTRHELRGLGHGGLCLECRDCVFPICGFGRGFAYSL
ncbi:MAG: molybdopterin-binding protein [Deltaproteobacteria bacterium]|jgi:molybdenum cofactor synthesis domain-containing protein|nr:molybdopterin-binding protein [Deltaproteobacteria bacterium]